MSVQLKELVWFPWNFDGYSTRRLVSTVELAFGMSVVEEYHRFSMITDVDASLLELDDHVMPIEVYGTFWPDGLVRSWPPSLIESYVYRLERGSSAYRYDLWKSQNWTRGSRSTRKLYETASPDHGSDPRSQGIGTCASFPWFLMNIEPRPNVFLTLTSATR